MVSTSSSFTPPEAGRLYRRTQDLQDNIMGSAASVVGTVWEVRPNAPDNLANVNQNASMWFYCEQSTAVGNPTTELFLVGSPDGLYWQSICQISRQLTIAEAIVEIREIDALPRFIAVMSRLGGGGAPTHNFLATLISDAGLTIDTTPAAAALTPNLTYVDAIGTSAADLALATSKPDVEAATNAALPAYTRVGNVITENTAAAGLVVDGLALAAGDRFLLKNGAAGADNGIYVCNTAGGTMVAFVATRVADMDASADVANGVRCYVRQGDRFAKSSFRMTTIGAILLNTTALVFEEVNSAPWRDNLTDHGAVRLATAAALAAYTRVGDVITENAAAAGLTIDGVLTVVGDRILLKNGAAAADDGIYVVTVVGGTMVAFVLTRAEDGVGPAAALAGRLVDGSYVRVALGDRNAGQEFMQTTADPIVINTTGQVWDRSAGIGDALTGASTLMTAASVTIAVAGAITTDHCWCSIEADGATTPLGALVSCNVTAPNVVTAIFTAAGTPAATVRAFVLRDFI